MKESERTTEYREPFKHTTSLCFHSLPAQHIRSSSIHKPVMAEAATRTRGRTCFRFIKCLFVFIILFILSVLCLIFIAIWAKNQVVQQILKRVSEDINKHKEDGVNRRAAITKIFDLANSLDSNEKLEIFKETIQTAIEQEERLKEESKYKVTTFSKQYNEKMKELMPQLKEAMISSYPFFPPLEEIVEITFHMLKKTGAYIDKKLDLLQE
ncbi:uncharacterized protein LOC109199722 [Oreochromis niloticus]|uniref:uncharacterized protein LOC109199722 n=1 Tax=Oreochromis niloticus TaxID=8128 RepID=UPI000905593B|nr:uncharacterized protein LOC109199722 [Oreochromis niloticus]